ncbi:MAG: transposase [Aggregatilineales bacterium]
MNPKTEFCPTPECPDRGKVGAGNIVIHSPSEKRYYCKTCHKTFSERKGTALSSLKQDERQFVQVVTLLAHGCPTAAIVAAFELDERTVKAWYQRAGQQCEPVHETVVSRQALDLGQVQADEIRVKTQLGIVWMALAIMVSPRRDKQLIQQLVEQIRAIAQFRPLLFAVDGLRSYVTAFRRCFRLPVRSLETGCWHLEPEPQVVIVQVVKSTMHSATFSISRRIVQGTKLMVSALIHATSVLYLDKGFCTGPIVRYLMDANLPAILAACRRENFSSRSTPFLTQNLIVSVINWS